MMAQDSELNSHFPNLSQNLASQSKNVQNGQAPDQHENVQNGHAPNQHSRPPRKRETHKTAKHKKQREKTQQTTFSNLFALFIRIEKQTTVFHKSILLSVTCFVA